MKNNKLFVSANEGLKSFLGVSVPSTEIIPSSSYRGPGNLPESGYLFNTPSLGYDVFFSYNGLEDVVKAYEQCPPVYSIINKQAYSYTNGKNYILKTSNGKVATNEKAKKIMTLLQKPNPMQNWRQFKAQYSIYLRLFGYCIIIPVKPVGYGMEDATALWIVPPYMCSIKYAKTSYYMLKNGFIESVKISFGNEVTTITNVENLIFLKDITPGFDDSLFMPSGSIKPLKQNINNLVGIYNSKGTIINYRGALGILTPEIDPNGAIALDPLQKEELQNDLMKYGIRSGQWKFIVANSAMKWQQMGVDPASLQLTEWAEDDMMIVCDGLNYPFKLLANTKSSSMNGTELKEWKTHLYEEFTIPFAEIIDEQWTEVFKLAEDGMYFNSDYSHVPCMQADQLKNAQTRKSRNDGLLIEFHNNMITLNMWLEKNGEDPIPAADGVDIGMMYYYQLVEQGLVFGGGSIKPVTDEEDKNKEKPKV